MTKPATAHSPASPITPARYRIALVEDHREIRENLLQLIATFAQFECVCACSSGEEALKCIPPSHPDVVLMDIFLPRMSGIECSARLKGLLPQTRILILTASDDDEMVFPALEAGADGYLLKQDEPQKLCAALLDLLNGGVPMTTSIARHIVDYFRRRTALREQLVHLTPREKEILLLLSKGYSNKEIGGRLFLGVETIHSYLRSTYEKMHVHSRAEAVAKYMSSADS